jgi:N-acetyl-anhydromuramoyl-L-alanine amidase
MEGLAFRLRSFVRGDCSSIVQRALTNSGLSGGASVDYDGNMKGDKKIYSVSDGWLQQARHVLSPNCGPRPVGCEPDLLVVHNISLPPGEYGSDAIERFFTNCLDCDQHPFYEEIRGVEVSAHLLIRRDGELVQFVSFDDRAWHAGQSSYQGRENCNDFSIGIELEGTDEDPYTHQQYLALAGVTAALLAYYQSMNARRIAGHSDIAPGRKTDPGVSFSWNEFRSALALQLAAK